MARGHAAKGPVIGLLVITILLLAAAVYVQWPVPRTGWAAGQGGPYAFGVAAAWGRLSVLCAFTDDRRAWDIVEYEQTPGGVPTGRFRLAQPILPGDAVFRYLTVSATAPRAPVLSPTAGFWAGQVGHPLVPVWKFQMPAWPFWVGGAWSALVLFRRTLRERARRLSGGVYCPCGYDLRGTLESERCPECGHVVDEALRQYATTPQPGS